MKLSPAFLFLTSFIASTSSLLAWGEPHLAITKAAIDALPQWQRDLLGKERKPLADSYCLIPDNVYSDKANAPFAAMESKPGEVYILNLHLPAQQPENLETLRYFLSKAVTAVSEGRMGDAARYMGTICHQLEDYGSPSHTVPGDNQFTLLQQFLPPSDPMKDTLMHGPIENGKLNVIIDGYKPALLGTSADEAAWRLLHRVHEGIINARSTTVPIMQALYAGDEAEKTKQQLRAATMDAKVVADALHTILCLGKKRFEKADEAALQRVDISSLFPLEAASLYYPQSQFFSSPYWGFPHSGFILEGGKKAVPLRLRISGESALQEKEFSSGMGAGMDRTLSFHLPKDVYARFTVLAGLQSGLGAKGRVEFTISGDGKPLATAIVSGTEPAHLFDCDLGGVSQLELTLKSKGLDARSNYAVWAEPTLVKKP